MANKPRRRRRRGRLIVPRINKELALGTLADNTLLSATVGTNAGQESWLISADLTWALSGHTAGEGPILVGIAHEDYSDAEIEAAIEATTDWIVHDQIGQELAKRKVRVVGHFSGVGVDETLNDGKPIRTKCNWRNGPDDTFKFWAYSQAASLTTGTLIHVNGKAFLRPL